MKRLALLGLIAALVAGCAPARPEPATPTSARAATARHTARLGAALSLTGSSAAVGAAQRNGLVLAVDEINAARTLGSVRLDLRIEDDASDRTHGVEAFRKLIDTHHVLAILGPTLSDTAYAADPIAQQVGVPVLGISNAAGGITEIGSFIFRNCLGENQLTPQTVRMVKSRLKLRSAALLYADTASNRTGSSGFKKALQDNGITITTEQTFNRGDTLFTEQLLQIGDSRPDALFVSAAGPEASAILVQARGLEMDALPIVGGNAFNSSAVLKNAGSAAEGLVLGSAWSAASPTPRNQEFIQGYRERFGQEPDQFAAQAYTGVYILAAAISDANTTSDRRALRDALERVKGLETPLGRFAFKPNREADLPAVVQVFRNGKLELLGK